MGFFRSAHDTDKEISIWKYYRIHTGSYHRCSNYCYCSNQMIKTSNQISLLNLTNVQVMVARPLIDQHVYYTDY